MVFWTFRVAASELSGGFAFRVFLRSSFDLSVNHLGVLLHGEVDLWDGRDHFAKLQLILPLLDI